MGLLRIWNAAVDHRPLLIALYETIDDVQLVVRAGHKYGLPLCVLGDGYDWTGRSLWEQGLVIDLSAMRQVTVDPKEDIALVQGGATAEYVVTAAAQYGLTAVVAAIGKIGMVGFTLGAGYGPLAPRFGLGLDNLSQ